MKISKIGVVVVFVMMVSSLASAQVSKKSYSRSEYASNREGVLQAGLGVGMVFHDPAADLRYSVEYFLDHNISAGLDLDLIFHNSVTYAFDLVGRYHMEVPELPSRLVPYAGAGLGAVVNTNGDGGLDILLPSVGCRYEVLASRLFIGPDLGVHILTDFSDATWDVSLMFVNAVYRF